MSEPDRFVDHVARLQARLSREIAAALYEFEQTTGVYPSAVDVHVIEVTPIGAPVAQYRLAGVHLRFDA